MAALLFIRQILYSDIPALIENAKAHPRRSFAIFILLILLLGFFIIICTPVPQQPEKTKEQREKYLHENRVICGEEYDRRVEEIHANCDQIKASKDRLPSFMFDLLKISIEQKKSLRNLCCEDRCNELELEEIECWEAAVTPSPSPPSPHSPSFLFFLLVLGGISALVATILVGLWAFRRARATPTDVVPLI